METYFDSHCHLTLLEHSPPQSIITRARADGVRYMVSVSTDPKNWELNRLVAEKEPDIYYSIGLHPHEAKDWEDCQSAFLNYFPENRVPDKCVAIGETGLDFFYNYSPRDQQIGAFEEQIRQAHLVGLPIIIHCRDAFVETYDAIKRLGIPKAGGVMHCFTGNWTQAKQALDLGLDLSFSGIITFKKADALREAATNAPKDRILIETDCPFLTPVPHRGKPNEPSYLPFTASQLSSLRNTGLAEVAEQTTQNAKRLFNIK